MKSLAKVPRDVMSPEAHAHSFCSAPKLTTLCTALSPEGRTERERAMKGLERRFQ